MADDIFSSMLGPTDLLGFQNSVAQSDPYGITGRSLAAWQPDTSTWSPTETGITAFMKSFAAGLLQNYGQQNAADQLNSVIGVLPQLRQNPMSVVAPEGVDAAPFAALKANAILKNYQREALKDETDKKFDSDLLARLLGKRADAIGENLGKEAVYGKDFEDPDSPQYKTDQDKIDLAQKGTDTERQLANDFNSRIQIFKLKEQGLKALTEAYKDPTGTSDYELIRRAAQAVEPGLAVRQDDIQSIEGAASALGMTTAAIKAAISGDTKLSDPVRAGIMRIAKRSYDASLDDYNTTRNSFLTRAEAAKISGAAVVPFGAAKPFQELYPDLKIDDLNSPMNAIDAELARRGLYPDGSRMAPRG